MPKTKEQKQQTITDLKQKVKEQKATVLVDFAGVESKMFFKLRDTLKETGCALKVVKKTLLKKVLEEAKRGDLIKGIEAIPGQMAMAFGFDDETQSARICWEFQENNKDKIKQLRILGGIMGESFLTAEEVVGLAKLPSKPILLGQLAGTMQAPISNFVYVLQGNIKGLVTVLSKIKQ